MNFCIRYKEKKSFFFNFAQKIDTVGTSLPLTIIILTGL